MKRHSFVSCRILQYHDFNLLRWNDVSRTSRIFCPKIAIFFSQVHASIIQAKQIIN